MVKGGYVKGGEATGEHETFPDESFSVKFAEPGIVAFANDGPHTNKTSYFVTLAPAKWLDFKYVAFGRVISGMEAYEAIDATETKNERPLKACKVTAGGIVDLEAGHVEL